MLQQKTSYIILIIPVLETWQKDKKRILFILMEYYGSKWF